MQITKNFWDLANFLLVFVHRFYLKKKKKRIQANKTAKGGRERKDSNIWKRFENN